MNFSKALEALKEGERVARVGWNGKDMWIGLVASNKYEIIGFTEMAMAQCPFIAMKTADHKVVPWLASQTDILADDWAIVVHAEQIVVDV